MQGQARSTRKRAWPLLIPLLALGAGTVWWLARGPSHKQEQVATAADPMAFVAARRALKENPHAINELIEAYSKWAKRPEALEARKAALQALLETSDVRLGVTALMTAVANDPTPRYEDPLWPDLVKGVSSMWNALTFPFGRDLVMIEERVKPKDLMIDSMIEMGKKTAATKLTDEQRPQLVSDLIDLYPSMKPDQKVEAERALQSLTGNTDVGEVLSGRGLAEGGAHLHANVEHEREMAAMQGKLKNVPPPADNE